ncbi:MAG: hypothetical protein J6Q96_02830 [Bacteroidales bacterium]|nr:hypothetical protein [Bacteroidales bacterium]
MSAYGDLLDEKNYEIDMLKQYLEIAIEALEVAQDALTDIWLKDGIDLPKARLHIERVLKQIK